MAESNKKTDKKEESEQEKRNKQLREAYEKSIANFEQTSNTLLSRIREQGISIHTPDPSITVKQRPEEISDIHILFSQQKPETVKEGKDDSEEQEKKANAKADAEADKDKSDDSSSSTSSNK